MRTDIIIDCPLCHKNKVKVKYKEFPGYQEPHKFIIYHCEDCNTSFSWPQINTDKLYDTIYRNGYNVPGYNRYWEYALTVKKLSDPIRYLCQKEDTYWAIRTELLSVIKDKKFENIAEIGSGLGYLTYSLIKEGYQVTGVDISQIAVEYAKSNFGNNYLCEDVNTFADSNSGKFNAVIITEVIEHIDKPVEFIRTIKKMLKPGGSIILTTPNKTFYSDDIIWATELPPVHMWWFSEDSFRYIADLVEMSIYLTDFSSYYKTRYYAINMDKLHNSDFPGPFLDTSGVLIPHHINSLLNNLSALKIKALIFPVIKKNIDKLKKLFNQRITICDKRGITLSVVLTRKD